MNAADVDRDMRVLLVEDDERLARLTARYLEDTGFRVTVACTGPQGVSEAVNGTYDVVLLDVMLPGLDGVGVCRAIRERLDVPIIMVTARREEADRVLGLEQGADDYVVKPFSSRELVSRIRANVRRARGLSGPPNRPIRLGSLMLDPATMRVTVEEREVELTLYEFAVLNVLAQSSGRIVTREALLERATSGATEAFDRSIDIHVSRLRQKLGDDPRRPRFVRTIRGVGYMLISGSRGSCQ